MAEAIAEALRHGRPELVEAASRARHQVATEQLIPRTDRNVSGQEGHLQQVEATAADPALALEHMVRTSMLDMAPPRSQFQQQAEPV
jgi:hypothetical protein